MLCDGETGRSTAKAASLEIRGEVTPEDKDAVLLELGVGVVPWATCAAHFASSLHLVLPAGRPTENPNVFTDVNCFPAIYLVE